MVGVLSRSGQRDPDEHRDVDQETDDAFVEVEGFELRILPEEEGRCGSGHQARENASTDALAIFDPVQISPTRAINRPEIDRRP